MKQKNKTAEQNHSQSVEKPIEANMLCQKATGNYETTADTRKGSETLSDALRCNAGTNREHIRDIRASVQKILDEIDIHCNIAGYKSPNYEIVNALREEIKEIIKSEMGEELVK